MKVPKNLKIISASVLLSATSHPNQNFDSLPWKHPREGKHPLHFEPEATYPKVMALAAKLQKLCQNEFYQFWHSPLSVSYKS